MRVNGQNSLGTTAETGGAPEAQKLDRSDSSRSSAVDAGEDRVGLSATLGRISQALSSYNAQHASRVQALTAQYQQGQYQSDAQATSNAMLEQAFSF